jgi:hypothetical protein
LSASLKSAQTLPGDGPFAVLKTALEKKADVEMLVIGGRNRAAQRHEEIIEVFAANSVVSLWLVLVYRRNFLQEIASFWNFLEARRKFFGTFWRFFGTYSSKYLLKQCRGAGGAGSRSERSTAGKTFLERATMGGTAAPSWRAMIPVVRLKLQSRGTTTGRAAARLATW